MLQAQKLRLTDHLDERSAFLTQFAEEAKAEIDAIGENALKDLDQATARIMEKIERKMQELEEECLEMEKQETEKRDKEVEDLEGEIEKGRNEGMFFQSFRFRQRKPMDRARAKEEARRTSDHVIRKSAASTARRNIFLALIGLLTIGILNSLLFYPQNWRKIAPLALIFIALLSQFFYGYKMLPKNNGINKDEKTK